jgi:Na+(H+)/acetate symporter ActP
LHKVSCKQIRQQDFVQYRYGSKIVSRRARLLWSLETMFVVEDYVVEGNMGVGRVVEDFVVDNLAGIVVDNMVEDYVAFVVDDFVVDLHWWWV